MSPQPAVRDREWQELCSSAMPAADIEKELSRMKKLTWHRWLCEERAIGKEILSARRFRGRVRVDERRNAVSPHIAPSGEPIGFERRNSGFTSFSAGGQRGLWMSNRLAGDTPLFVCESPVDCMSHFALA